MYSCEQIANRINLSIIQKKTIKPDILNLQHLNLKDKKKVNLLISESSGALAH